MGLPDIVVWVLLVTVPVYVGRRLRASGATGVFNILLYPLVLSYAYLLLPSLITIETPLSISLRLTDDSQSAINALAAWYVFVFLVAYRFSTDPLLKFNPDFQVRGALRFAAQAAQIGSALLMLYVILRHGPALLEYSGSRLNAYEYYSEEILNVYKIQVAFAACLGGSTIMYLATGNLVQLAPLSLFVILDALHGGRGYTLSVLIGLYVNVLARDRALFRKATLIAVATAFLVFSSAFVRRYIMTAAETNALVDYAGEFYYTRLTARYTYDKALGAEGLGGYLLASASRLLPQSVVGEVLGARDPFIATINAEINAGFGLAGSILTEALYYGGVVFAVVNPLLIVGLLWLVARRRFLVRLPGYLLFLLTVATSHVFFRGGFYGNFFGNVYTVYVYLGLFAVLGARKRVLLSLARTFSGSSPPAGPIGPGLEGWRA